MAAQWDTGEALYRALAALWCAGCTVVALWRGHGGWGEELAAASALALLLQPGALLLPWALESLWRGRRRTRVHAAYLLDEDARAAHEVFEAMRQVQGASKGAAHGAGGGAVLTRGGLRRLLLTEHAQASTDGAANPWSRKNNTGGRGVQVF